MKRVLFLFLAIFFCSMCEADDLYQYGYYTYKIENENKKQIWLFTYSDAGENTSLNIPSTIEHNNETYSVTKLVGPYSAPTESDRYFIQDGCVINDIYFPSSLTEISCVSREKTTIKYAIFENGDNITNYGTYGIFYNNNTPLSLEYVIIFNNSKKRLRSSYLVGSSNSEKFIENDITINYKDGTTEAVSMFLYYVTKGTNIFDNTTFNNLISALQRRGTDLSTISSIDLSKVTTKFTISFEDNPANMLPFGAQITTNKNGTYISTNIIDKVNFTAPTDDITANISYTRTNTRNWNSVCLPFDIKETDFGTKSKIYTVTAASNDQISLTRVETVETVVEAGTPCFIYSNDDEWNLNITDATISNNVAAKTLDVEGYQVVGSFTNETIGTGNYKLNSEGTEFGRTNNESATVTAFRCYITSTGSQDAPARLGVNIDEEASITLVPNDAQPQKVILYDLMGHPRKEGSQGLFIKSAR